MKIIDGKTLVLLWLGGFFLGVAIATCVFHGLDLTPVLFGGSGGVLSGLAIWTIFGL
jgi:hypothetical protein